MARKGSANNGPKTNNSNGANVRHKAQLVQLADVLGDSMDASEYKHFVLDLMVLKHVSDTFEEQQLNLELEKKQRADPEVAGECLALNIFSVSAKAHGPHRQDE